MNIPSSPRFYAVVSKGDLDMTSPITNHTHLALSRTSTPAMTDPAPEKHLTQLSPILSNAGDPARRRAEPLPANKSIGQTPSPENNHWLNVKDRFILLGGDNEDFRAFVVEATNRAALVAFEAKAFRSPGAGLKSPREYWFPYVEPARVFISPGKSWYRILDEFKSIQQARELGVPKRKWLFVDGRDMLTREEPHDFAKEKANEFGVKLLEMEKSRAGEWEFMWEMMVGTAEKMGIREGWCWKEDLMYGFVWPPDVGTPTPPSRARSH